MFSIFYSDSHDVEMPKSLPQDPGELKELRKNIAMELLWVQQAIDSRKNVSLVPIFISQKAIDLKKHHKVYLT